MTFSTIFLLLMSGWMLALILQYGMAPIPVIAVLTAMMVSIRLIQHSITSRHVPLRFLARIK